MGTGDRSESLGLDVIHPDWQFLVLDLVADSLLIIGQAQNLQAFFRVIRKRDLSFFRVD